MRVWGFMPSPVYDMCLLSWRDEALKIASSLRLNYAILGEGTLHRTNLLLILAIIISAVSLRVVVVAVAVGLVVTSTSVGKACAALKRCSLSHAPRPQP